MNSKTTNASKEFRMNKSFILGLCLGAGMSLFVGISTYAYFKKKFQDRFAKEMDEIQHLNDISKEVKKFSEEQKQNTKSPKDETSTDKKQDNNFGVVIPKPKDHERVNYSSISVIDDKPDDAEVKAYSNIVAEYDKKEESEKVTHNEPYFIQAEDIDDDTSGNHDVEFLYLYSDGVLANDEGVIVENVDVILGKGTIEQFDENKQDNKIYIRNDKNKCDYVIEKDSRPYFKK